MERPLANVNCPSLGVAGTKADFLSSRLHHVDVDGGFDGQDCCYESKAYLLV